MRLVDTYSVKEGPTPSSLSSPPQVGYVWGGPMEHCWLESVGQTEGPAGVHRPHSGFSLPWVEPHRPSEAPPLTRLSVDTAVVPAHSPGTRAARWVLGTWQQELPSKCSGQHSPGSHCSLRRPGRLSHVESPMRSTQSGSGVWVLQGDTPLRQSKYH